MNKQLTKNKQIKADLIFFAVKLLWCLKGNAVTRNLWKLKKATIHVDHNIRMALTKPNMLQVLFPPHQPQFMNEAIGIKHCNPNDAVSEPARQQIKIWICLAPFGVESLGFAFNTAIRASMLTTKPDTNSGKMSTLKQASSSSSKVVLFILTSNCFDSLSQNGLGFASSE